MNSNFVILLVKWRNIHEIHNLPVSFRGRNSTDVKERFAFHTCLFITYFCCCSFFYPKTTNYVGAIVGSKSIEMQDRKFINNIFTTLLSKWPIVTCKKLLSNFLKSASSSQSHCKAVMNRSNCLSGNTNCTFNCTFFNFLVWKLHWYLCNSLWYIFSLTSLKSFGLTLY